VFYREKLNSFGTELVKAVHSSDVEKLGTLLSCGLSPNPCNQFRDSIVDLVCKRANHEIFQCLVDHGCDLRVCDGFGRTPLHHCCWASEFSPEIAELILKRDWLQLLIEDKRGQTPLEYMRPDTAGDWILFLESLTESLFPIGDCVPPLESLKELRPDGVVPDPPNALPSKLAEAVSSGHMTPEEDLDLSPGMKERFE
jgi:ankyrin repeat protein